MIGLGNDPFGQVVDFLKIDPSANGEFTRAPEIFQRRFRRSPAPPNTNAWGAFLGEFARHDRPVIADALSHAIEHLLGIRAQASYPVLALGNILTGSRKARLPVRIPLGGNDRGIMSPVFK